jgi:phage gpG-like protein
MTIKTNIPLKTLNEALRRRAGEIGRPEEANRQVSVFLDSWVQRNFRSEGGSVGGWTPFARGGRWIKGQGLDTSAKLLQHTGALRLSFRAFFDSTRAGIGSDLHYAKYHHEGTDRLPKRQLLPERENVLPQVRQIYESYARDMAGRRLW